MALGADADAFDGKRNAEMLEAGVGQVMGVLRTAGETSLTNAVTAQDFGSDGAPMIALEVGIVTLPPHAGSGALFVEKLLFLTVVKGVFLGNPTVNDGLIELRQVGNVKGCLGDFAAGMAATQTLFADDNDAVGLGSGSVFRRLMLTFDEGIHVS